MAGLNSQLLVKEQREQTSECSSRLFLNLKHRQATRTTIARRAQLSKKSPAIRVKNESPYALLQHRKDFPFMQQDDHLFRYLTELRKRQDQRKGKQHSPEPRTRPKKPRGRAEDQVSLLLCRISGRSGSAGLPSSSESPAANRRFRARKENSNSAEPLRSLSREMSGSSLGSSESPRLADARVRLTAKIEQSLRSTGTVPPTTSGFYLFGHMLGKGAFGKVYLGIHKLTGSKVAIKSIEKTYLKDERVKRKVYQEVAGMSRIKHPTVVRLYEVFESPKHFHIVMEFCGDGTLLQLIQRKGRLSEPQSAIYFRQLIQAIKACHQSGVAHRDLKLENVFLEGNVLKLGDFGMSRVVKPGQKVQEQCGTLAYAAPEILTDREYEPFPVDIWGLGVILYSMLIGKAPFKAASDQDLSRAILRGELTIPSVVSPLAGELIRRLLDVQPAHRPSLGEVETDRWLEGFPEEESVVPQEMAKHEEVLERMNRLGFAVDSVLEALRSRELNHATATYHILMSDLPLS